MDLQGGCECADLSAQGVHLALVRLQGHRVSRLIDFRHQLADDQVVIQQLPFLAGPYVHPVLSGHLVPGPSLQLLPGMHGDLVPGVVVDGLDPDVAHHNPGRRRLRRGIEDGPVSQGGNPAVDAGNRLGDGAAALPVADGRLNVGIGTQIQGVDLRDGRLTGEKLIRVDHRRRDLVHQGVAGVDVRGIQFAGRDLRGRVDRPPVVGMARGDFLRRGCHLCGSYRAVHVHVQLVVVVVRRLDHQVADGGAHRLRVVHAEARDEQLVRHAGLDHRLAEVGALGVQVLHLREVDVRQGDPRVRDGCRPQGGVDGCQVCGVDLRRRDGSGADLFSGHRAGGQLFGCDGQRRDL